MADDNTAILKGLIHLFLCCQFFSREMGDCS